MWLIVFPGEHRYRGILDFFLLFTITWTSQHARTTLMCKWRPWQKCVQALDYGGILYSLMPPLHVCQLSISQNAFRVMYPPHFTVRVWWAGGWGLANFDGSLSRMQLGKSCAKHGSEPMFALISARNREFALNTAWPLRQKREVYRESGPVPCVWQNLTNNSNSLRVVPLRISATARYVEVCIEDSMQMCTCICTREWVCTPILAGYFSCMGKVWVRK